MVKILTLERQNVVLVQFGMNFARGACLFVCLLGPFVWSMFGSGTAEILSKEVSSLGRVCVLIKFSR